jgi:hypothetical protein
MSIRPSIPEVQNVKDPAAKEVLQSLKNAVEMITGRGYGQKTITALGQDTNYYGIVQKINEIIYRLQSDPNAAKGAFGSLQTPQVIGVPGPTQTTTLTGDVSGSGTTSIATTLATVITSATAGSSSQVPVIVWDHKGRLAQVTTATVTPASIGAVSTNSAVITGTATLANATVTGTHSGNSSGTNTGDQTIILTGDVLGTGSGSFATTLSTVTTDTGTFGSATTVPTLSVNAKGLVTGVGTATITSTGIGGLTVAQIGARVSLRA